MARLLLDHGWINPSYALAYLIRSGYLGLIG